MRRFWPVVPLLVLCLPSYGGCNPFGLFGGDDGGVDACEVDPAGCGQGGEFELDPSCTLDGELVVALGEGTGGSYAPLGLDELPEVHFGTQGGSHMWLGARVGNHARDYAQLEFTVRAFRRRGACEPECTWELTSERTLVLDEPDLEYTDDGGAQAGGITIFAGEETGAIELLARDPCGREGSVRHEE